MTFLLPPKLDGHLRRLSIEYRLRGRTLDLSVVENARIHVEENTYFDNWDGGTYSHDLIFYLDLEFFNGISLAEQAESATRICGDLNSMAEGVDRENWRRVNIEVSDPSDVNFTFSRPPLRRRPTAVTSETMWESGKIRLFISHRDLHKRKASDLARSLNHLGISSFVAHDSIEATKEWRSEIISGLATMDALLAFVTDDFHESTFTNQEIGYALGKGIPIISFKLGAKDPPGFISHEQAERGQLNSAENAAIKIAKHVYRKLGRENELSRTALEALCHSPNFNETIERFNTFSAISTVPRIDDIELIVSAFNQNDQLYRCAYLTNYNRILTYINKNESRKYSFDRSNKNKIAIVDDKIHDDIAF
ncbi:toll/interleukin-1 receptor domain-containing protein [Ancylobacter sp. VNQ12]|uniref:toll/interleukin-1 receptor domain-containing protein n=1 Tax=Ancylobacter sp. VNQ12 TaxID=3400920 RepID=UPI003C053C7E